jgi:hypothetical protein
MALLWEVYATPISAHKLGRLGIEHGEVVVRPAFFRAFGDVYGVVARATCPFGSGDPAPGPECSCGFYEVARDDELWRLGVDDPDLAVLDVELSGRVIEHAHGYRASHQHIRRVCVSTAAAHGAGGARCSCSTDDSGPWCPRVVDARGVR